MDTDIPCLHQGFSSARGEGKRHAFAARVASDRLCRQRWALVRARAVHE